ncbi:keratin, type I cytoskeletal 9 [Hyalella azteca]|uniref:Keratin, type I cytoskeletal 9 n=1 Tax=Hyalella azteca TaxID=294128 RepID=A0A8B7NG10_HYAAZ|nr:keratin, type I cytoskeletal 9 [Hyalella azteca]
MSGGGYTSNFIENRNYGNSFDTGIQEGYRSGNRQRTGVGETVTINVTPVTKTRKTEIRREQEFQNGQQTYDLRHERQFTDGSLIHEEYSEKGPDELGTGAHRDALQDILSGRTLTTASESNYRPASTANSHSQHYQGSSYSTQTQRDSNNYVSEHQRGNSGSTQRGQNTAGINPNAAIESSRVNSQLGTNLLNSGARTFVIGDGGIGNYESLHSASGVSTGSRTSGTKYDGERSEETEDESYSSFGAGTESQTGSSSYSNEISSSSEASHRGASVGTYGTTGYDAFGNFEAYAGGDRTGGRAISHQREMEVEEHYENGQLVRGREAEKEWKNNELQKHEERVYGQGEAIRGRGTSVQVSPGLTSSSSFGTYGGSAGGSTIFGATGSFGAYSPQSGADYNAQPSVYGSHNGYQSQSSAFNIESSSSGSQGATYGIPGYPGGGVGGVTHRREMEVEEHYENGQLVHGREEEKEWKNDNLLKHERRHYGEEHAAQPSSSALTSTSSSGVSSSRLFHDSVEGQCSARPCNNGASCVTGTRGYLCVCTFGFRGLRCDEAYCPTRYCRHDGICQIKSDGTHSCSCPVTHTGPRCEIRVRDRGTQ